MEKTPEDEEFERMLAKIDLQHTPSKDSQLVSLRRWEIDEMIRLAVLAEREECAKICDEHSGYMTGIVGLKIRARGQE
jgi:hypothetical protein